MHTKETIDLIELRTAALQPPASRTGRSELSWPWKFGAVAAVCLAWPALLQAQAALPQFETASFRYQPPAVLRGSTSRQGVSIPMRGWHYSPGRVSCSLQLREILREAFGLQGWQINGPAFLDQGFYSLEATMPEGTKRSEARLMIQALLKERLQLRYHLEQKMTAVFALQVDKTGLKMKPLPSRPASTGMGGEAGHFFGNGVTIANLIPSLARLSGRPVLDETGLKDYFDFDWKWTPDPDESGGANGPDPVFPRVLREQAGLRLEPRKAPLDTLIVDHVEKMPAEN
jgi:uncharacterized protein (TIGR03435 family)